MASYWAVLFTKDATQKKVKKYEDGILSVDGKQAILYDLDGKQQAREFTKNTVIKEGDSWGVSRFTAEILHSVTAAAFLSGSLFVSTSSVEAVRHDTPLAARSSVPGPNITSATPVVASLGVSNASFVSSGSAVNGGRRTSLLPPRFATPFHACSSSGAAYAASLVEHDSAAVAPLPATSSLRGAVTAGKPRIGFTPFKPPTIAPSAGVERITTSRVVATALVVHADVDHAPDDENDSISCDDGSADKPESEQSDDDERDPSAQSAALAAIHRPQLQRRTTGVVSAAAAAGVKAVNGGYSLSAKPGVGSSLLRGGRSAAGLIASGDPLVLQSPSASSAGDQFDVVVDSFLASKLRPHQRNGVRFLWECVQGMRPDIAGTANAGYGCILADDMGLGKTLQTITLMWTALRQSVSGVPAVSKAIIVCPSSLVSNWRAEFKKWLGDERIRPLAINVGGAEAAQLVADFVHGSSKVHPVLIISYEMLRKHAAVISAGGSGGTGSRVGLLVCDEAHRLKAVGGNQTINALLSLRAPRRILLTGTPIQNDTGELYAMVSFAVPGSLGTLPQFRNTYQSAIDRGRDASATPAEAALAEARVAALSARVGRFVLRRTSEVMEAHLPPKTETLLFVRLSHLQAALYMRIAQSKSTKKLFSGDSAKRTSGAPAEPVTLLVLNLLRQVAAHPDLVHPAARAESTTAQGAATACAGSDSARVPVQRPLGIAKRARREAAPEASELLPNDTEDEGNLARIRASCLAPSVLQPEMRLSTSRHSVLDGKVVESECSSNCRSDSSGDNDDSCENSDDASTAAPATTMQLSSHAPDVQLDRAQSTKRVGFAGKADIALVNDASFATNNAGAVLDSNASIATAAAAALAGDDTVLVSAPGMTGITEALAPLFPPDYIFNALRNSTTEEFPRGSRPRNTAAALHVNDAAARLRAWLDASSKMRMLDALLSSIWNNAPGERVVVVSSFATTLTLVERLCIARGHATTRLDGSTPADKRHVLVKAFNAGMPVPSLTGPDVSDEGGKPAFIFLLSAQAGGVGLNLIGASRLVLLDCAWNPAIDAQALARVWREGQRRHTFIYRIVATGTLEEKVFQRQLSKQSLAVAVGSNSAPHRGGKGGAQGDSSARFSAAELRELFELDATGIAAAGARTCDTRAMMMRLDSSGDGGAAASWPAYNGVDARVDSVLHAAVSALDVDAAPPWVTYARQINFNVPAATAGVPAVRDDGKPLEAPTPSLLRALQAAEDQLALSDSDA